MNSNPRGQHEIYKHIRKKEQDNLKIVQRNLTEGEAVGIINWADLPETKKFKKFITTQEAVVDKKLDANDWDFETGRGLCFLRSYLKILDRYVERAKKTHKQIQDGKLRKSKEG